TPAAVAAPPSVQNAWVTARPRLCFSLEDAARLRWRIDRDLGFRRKWSQIMPETRIHGLDSMATTGGASACPWTAWQPWRCRRCGACAGMARPQPDGRTQPPGRIPIRFPRERVSHSTHERKFFVPPVPRTAARWDRAVLAGTRRRRRVRRRPLLHDRSGRTDRDRQVHLVAGALGVDVLGPV